MYQRTLTRLGRRFLFRKFWEKVRPPQGGWEGLASCPLVAPPGKFDRDSCNLHRIYMSVSQSVISRSRPALTPPPARSPAPPLPVGDL